MKNVSPSEKEGARNETTNTKVNRNTAGFQSTTYTILKCRHSYPRTAFHGILLTLDKVFASWHTAATASGRSTFRMRGWGFTTGCLGTAVMTLEDSSANAVER